MQPVHTGPSVGHQQEEPRGVVLGGPRCRERGAWSCRHGSPAKCPAPPSRAHSSVANGCCSPGGLRPPPPWGQDTPTQGAWLLTPNVRGLGGLTEVVLEVEFRVLGQRAPQRLGQHDLQQVHPAQGPANGMQPQGLLLTQDGPLQVGLACMGQSCHTLPAWPFQAGPQLPHHQVLREEGKRGLLGSS